jgi:tRNA C32,U32 (ribose-2'-O)-methylase TrmJ
VAQAVPDAAVVLGTADEDSDGFVVVISPEHVVDEGDVEVELAGVFGLELAGLEFDDDVA